MTTTTRPSGDPGRGGAGWNFDTGPSGHRTLTGAVDRLGAGFAADEFTRIAEALTHLSAAADVIESED